MASQPRASERDRGCEEDRERQPDRVLDPPELAVAERAEVGVVDDDQIATRHHLRHAVEHEARRERGDERVDPEDRDEEGVHEAEPEAAERAEQQGGPHADVRHELRGGDAADREHRADREVEAAADDHERLHVGDDRGGRHLVEDVQLVRTREEDVALDAQVDEEHEDAYDDSVLADAREPRGDGQPDAQRLSALDGRAARAHRPPPAAPGATAVPNAACTSAGSFTSAPSNSATIRPVRITSTRCASRATSSNSDEMRMTAVPSAASESSSSWIAALAPTSTPRVGSSAISTAGDCSSHLANNAFCWFPPDSSRIGAVSVRARTSTFCATAPTARRSWRPSRKGPRERSARWGRAMFSRIGRRISRP